MPQRFLPEKTSCELNVNKPVSSSLQDFVVDSRFLSTQESVISVASKSTTNSSRKGGYSSFFRKIKCQKPVEKFRNIPGTNLYSPIPIQRGKCNFNRDRQIITPNPYQILSQVTTPASNPPSNFSTGSTGESVRVCFLNAQSLRQKTQQIKDLRDELDLDILLFVESWLKADDIVEIGELERDGECYFLNMPRANRPGGGVGGLIKSGLRAVKKESIKTATFEHLEIELQINNKMVTFILVYRPEASNKNRYRMCDFYDEFTAFLAHFHSYQNEIIIAGDFNFHVNKPDDHKAAQFINILEMFDLVQHIKDPTHKDGNVLDLVITRKNSLLENCSVGELISDHCYITFDLKVGKVSNNTKRIRIRKTRNMNMDTFKKDIKKHLDKASQMEANLDRLVELYNSTTMILDKHAPAEIKNIIIRKPTPWNNTDIKKLKTAKRKAEKRWRRSKLTKDYEMFKEKKNDYNTFLNNLKSFDLRQKINRTKGNSKAMFKIINSSLNRKQDLPLPNHDIEINLANDFNNFFKDKIENIRSKFSDLQTVHDKKMINGKSTLHEFSIVSQTEIKKLISDMPVKHCKLDPLPTWLLIECIEEFLPIITKIINLSLQSGEMPSTLKHALVKPLLKKAGMKQEKKNYRPVSNLSFLGKLIEGAVIKQYTDHLAQNKLDDEKQSAYKKFHSTETLLTKIHNDIMLSMGKGEVTILVLLDLSAAFDTIDQDILLRRLENRYGVSGNVLKWFKSYISGRSQSVVINDTVSEKLSLKYGVPQGSKLGPILFNSYIAPVSEIAELNRVKDEKYADDEQLILSFKPTSLSDQKDAKENMEKCIENIRKFLHDNMLCNNSEKTELILIGTNHQLNKLQFSSINVENTEIKAASHVRNLGVLFDKNMNMENQVNRMCRNAYFNLRNISKIRNSLDKNTAKTAINALVTPHLDYGNGLLYGICKRLENKLQVAQNSAVRVITGLKKHDHITKHRKDLHWLPINARIQYKLLTTIWKALNDQAPEYIKHLIKRKQAPNYDLRANKKTLLNLPQSEGVNSIEDRALSMSAPILWKDIPENVKTASTLESFKRGLKTYLFSKHYK